MDKQLVALSFAGGIDTKTDKFQVLPSKLLDLQNGVFNQTGAISKRWGYRRLGQGILGTPSAVASAFALNTFGQELLLYDGTLAYTYSSTRDAWVKRGNIVSIVASNQAIIRNANQQLSPDFNAVGGIEVYAWEDTRGGVRYSVLDGATGEYLLVDSPIAANMRSTAVRPKVLAFGGLLYVLYLDGGTLYAVAVNPVNPTAVAAAGIIVVGGQGVSIYDAQVGPDGAKLWIGFFSSTFSNQQLWSLGTNLAALSQLTVPGGAGAPNSAVSVALDAAQNVYFTAPSNGAPLSVVTSGYSAAGASLFSVTSVTQATGNVQAVAAIWQPALASLTVFVEALGSQTYNQVIYSNTVTAAGVLGVAAASAPVFKRSVGLASKPFLYGAALYVNVAFQSNLQSTYFTLDSAGREVCKVNPGLGGGIVANSDFMLPECVAVSNGIFKWANLVKGAPNTAAGTIVSLLGVNVTKEDFFDSNAFLSSTINRGLYTVGGILQSYDGAQYVEHGFNVYPEGVLLTPAGAGGALGTGTYNYVVTYEWPDNNGAIQRSTTSVAASTTFVSGSANQVTLTIPTLRLTKKANVKIVIYRTTANGVLLYRTTSALVPLYNNPAVDTVQFVDTQSDASLQSNELCYTQPLVTNAGNQVLQNAAPPACSLIATFADRLFVAGLDNPNQLAYTKAQTANVPMEFVASQLLNAEPDGGAITAIARMDDKLVVFKQHAIFYLTGQGPTATGDSNDFGDLVQVPSGGIGAASQNSIVSTPVGLMFDSGAGIYLLDRGLNVSFKGAPVQSLTSGVTITSATLIPNQWVVFTTSTDNAIVYDYFYDQWSRFSNHQGVDSVVYAGGGNLFAYATSSGKVLLQTLTTFQDDLGAPIVLSLTTAWLAMAQLQGYQRIYEAYLLGTYKGTHTLNVAIGTNYNDTFHQYAAIASDAALGIATFGSSSPFGNDPLFGVNGTDPDAQVYQFRVDVLQKCEAIRFQISDQQSAGANEGFSLSVLSLRVGAKRPAFKLPTVKQFGGV